METAEANHSFPVSHWPNKEEAAERIGQEGAEGRTETGGREDRVPERGVSQVQESPDGEAQAGKGRNPKKVR